jgi:HAE1 family hydrophobic/amphiphilic exporter-1
MTRSLILLAALCLSAFAQVESERRIGVTGERSLSLEESVQLALKNNLDIEIERTNVDTSRQLLKSAQGIFDPLVRYNPAIEKRATPQANTLFAANGVLVERFVANNFSALQQTPYYGLNTFLLFDNTRNTTNNPFTALNPYYQSRLTLGISLPLLRNHKMDQARALVKIRSKQVDQTGVEFENRVIEIVTRTREAYWDVVASLEQARVAEDGVNLARDQLERNKRQIASGTLAPVELAASEAELQRRIDTYVTTVGIVTAAENALKQLLTPDREDPLWNDRLKPTSAPTVEAPTYVLRDSVDVALKNRRELRILTLQTDQNDIRAQQARSQVLPQLNLVSTYANTGLAGTQIQNAGGGFASAFGPVINRVNELSAIAGLPPLPPFQSGGVPPAFIGGYGQNLSNMVSGDFQSFSVGLQFEWNPRNRTAEAELAQTTINERRLKLARRQVEQTIEAQVRNALQAVDTARQRIEAAKASERASREKLDSEIRLFQTGESTNFLVLTRQNELLDSRRRVVEADLLLNRAVTRYEQIVGTTLATNNIKLN